MGISYSPTANISSVSGLMMCLHTAYRRRYTNDQLIGLLILSKCHLSYQNHCITRENVFISFIGISPFNSILVEPRMANMQISCIIIFVQELYRFLYFHPVSYFTRLLSSAISVSHNLNRLGWTTNIIRCFKKNRCLHFCT